MKIALLYGSTHGTTKKIVKKLSDYISFEYDIFNVKDISISTFLLDYELLFLYAQLMEMKNYKKIWKSS